jgi:hypothetical protein
MSIAELIAEKLSTGTLEHPGDADNPPRTLLLPLFKPQAGMHPEIRAQQERLSGLSSKVIAEAIVALIETDHDIVAKQETP